MLRRTAVVAVTCLMGCIPSLNGNAPREAKKELPGSFSAEGTEATNAAQQTWDSFFASPDLRALIGAALKNNQELNIQLQELIIAQNEISAKKGEYLPRVNAFAGAGVDKVSKNSSQGVSDEAHGLP